MAGLKNNYQFEFTDTLTTSGTSVRISNEKENGAVATFTNQYITVRSEDNSIVERMKGSAAAGVLTLTMRGLDQSDTDTQDAGLKREWREGSKAFVTYVASQHVDPRDDNTFSGTQTFNNVVVSQDVTIGDDLTVTGDTTLNGKYKGPVVDDIAARDSLYPTPVDGNIVQVKSPINSIQFYQTSLGGRQTLGVGTPPADATDVVKGIQRNATNAEALAGISTNTTMTPDDTKYVLDRYNFTESLTAGEAMLAGEGYRRGNTALNLAGDTVSHTGVVYASNVRIGYDTTEQKQGQSFVATNGGLLTSITTYNYKTGSPTGNITCLLRTAAGGGTVVAVATNVIAESSLSSSSASPTTCVFTFANQRVPAGTYYIEQYCDRANSTSNYSNRSATTVAYAGGSLYNINSSDVWSIPASIDHRFDVVLSAYTEVNTKFYKALNVTNRSTVIGLVKANVVADATFTGIMKGYVKGFTGLTAGSSVFLQTDGTITHTITNKKVGEATASDTILLDIARHTESMVITRDVSLATGVVTYNHTMGEKPISVLANSLYAISGSMVYSSGTGIYNGSTQLSNVGYGNTGVNSTSNLITIGNSTTAYQTGFIQNITNNTFDISRTKVGSPTGTASIFLTLSL